MRLSIAAALVAVAVQTVLPRTAYAQLKPDVPLVCDLCDAWNKDVTPVKRFGNTYTVGTDGLSSVLVTSSAGHVLLDGALPQSAALIDQHIRALGFRTEDIKLILVSHGHYDHAGGVNALQRLSGARVGGSPSTATALRMGTITPDDPQAGFGVEANRFPKVSNVEDLADGQVLRVGDIAITVHHVPSHAPGSTAYTWRSCEGTDCRNVVYADSLTSVAAPGFRFSDDPARVATFRKSIAKVAALPCDILIAPHPSFAVGKTCKTYAADGEARLDQRLADEKKK
ncbi:MAG: subclass B3 metallo-beta-lactamase [Acidobacteria bacterium]|nr:subclass B3 metallo-beta-lactamase [Acidobacteriota bacterium]